MTRKQPRDPSIEEGMVDQFCKNYGLDKDDISEEGRELIVRRMDVMKDTTQRFTALQQRWGQIVQMPGRYEYFAFMLDRLAPPGSDGRLQWDLEFALFTQEEAAKAEAHFIEEAKPKLHLPDDETTAQINGTDLLEFPGSLGD